MSETTNPAPASVVVAAPAIARTLPVLTFASPSLRPPVLPALVWPSADPEDVLDYGLDFTPSLLPGEQIASATVLQSPATLTVSSIGFALSPFLNTVLAPVSVPASAGGFAQNFASNFDVLP